MLYIPVYVCTLYILSMCDVYSCRCMMNGRVYECLMHVRGYALVQHGDRVTVGSDVATERVVAHVGSGAWDRNRVDPESFRVGVVVHLHAYHTARLLT